MKINLEFTGGAAAVTGVKHLELELSKGQNYQDLIALLAEMYPDLVGFIISPDRCSLLSSVLFFVNQTEWIMPGMMENPLKDGDHLIILSVITGGS